MLFNTELFVAAQVSDTRDGDSSNSDKTKIKILYSTPLCF